MPRIWARLRPCGEPCTTWARPFKAANWCPRAKFWKLSSKPTRNMSHLRVMPHPHHHHHHHHHRKVLWPMIFKLWRRRFPIIKLERLKPPGHKSKAISPRLGSPTWETAQARPPRRSPNPMPQPMGKFSAICLAPVRVATRPFQNSLVAAQIPAVKWVCPVHSWRNGSPISKADPRRLLRTLQARPIFWIPRSEATAGRRSAWRSRRLPNDSRGVRRNSRAGRNAVFHVAKRPRILARHKVPGGKQETFPSGKDAGKAQREGNPASLAGRG